jgi:hypothetical protein
MRKSARASLVVLIAATLVALGWAMTTGKLTSWWSWPLWLAGFLALTLVATSA